MKYRNDLTQDYLKLILEYNPETGLFKWIYTRPKVQYGDIAGHTANNGYTVITIDGKKYRASRLANLYMTGEWPENEMDHANNVRNDDRWINLREATGIQNDYNYPVKHTNKLGIKGVYYYRGWYRAQIQINKVKIFLGQYLTIEEAKKVHDDYANKHQGEFVHSTIVKESDDAS